MIKVMRAFGDFAIGGENPADVAQEWEEAGFSPSEAADWLNVGCFNTDDAARLCAIGLTPEEVAEAEVDLEKDDSIGMMASQRGLGYAYANGDVSISDVLCIVGKEQKNDI